MRRQGCDQRNREIAALDKIAVKLIKYNQKN